MKKAGNAMNRTGRRIVIVISSLGGGGAERVVSDLCQYLADDNRSVTLLTLSGKDPDAYKLHPGVVRERMEIRRDAYSSFQSIKFTCHQIISIRRKILSLNPDVVLSFIDQANIRTIMSMIGSGIPVVISERIHPGLHRIPKGWDVLRKCFYRFASATVVQTEEIAEWFRHSIRTRKLVVIPNAVRCDDFPVVAQSSGRTILSVGRLTHQKGFDILLRAFAKSGARESGWRVVLLGEGPDRQALTQLAADLDISSSVEMPGYVSDVPRWMAEAGIFAFPSRFEGFPNALLEAMQSGLACVSADCPSGPRVLIDDGCNGLLVPVNDVDALARSIQSLSKNELMRIRLGREAAKVRDRFSPAHIYKLWAATLDSAMHPMSLAKDNITRGV
ncbi:glycosyltransferase family 4 protein [Nitrobacter sp.]|uniref:glycosyltransferase family 4 protein n=2 Tax=unclassified Nitrobacter TaxID=2620411 RepID=UPI001AC33FCC|nr:glycosyltransferase family 4 protein [Nitrobacter sp.]MBN9146851.1 glycosyltransferase family 4 protein [Nitrobacter sp.]